MLIGIDGACIEGKERTGLHTYLLSILNNLPKIAPQNEYRLYFKDIIPEYDFINKSCFKPKLLKKPKAFFWTNKPLWNTYCIPKELFFNKVDVFFATLYSLPVFWKKVKSIVVLHDISYEAHPEWFPPDWLNTMKYKSKIAAEKADLIVTNSEFCKSEIIKYYGVDEEKIFIINPGITRQFKPDKNLNDRTISKKYNINKPYILSVGALYPRRNTSGLIKAFKLICNKIKDYQLIIIGQNQDFSQENIPDLIKSVNRDIGKNKIIHIPFVSDSVLDFLYSNAELFINLSNYEGFGCFSMHEAMLYGCPLIAVKTSSMPELIADTGIYTDHQDIKQIGDTIYKVIKDGNLRKKISDSAQKRIKMFSAENMAKQFINACEYVYNN